MQTERINAATLHLCQALHGPYELLLNGGLGLGWGCGHSIGDLLWVLTHANLEAVH